MTEATRYVVQVETGDTDNFEPITDVYIVLCGKHGDSGQRYLSKSKEGGLLFELFKVSIIHWFIFCRLLILFFASFNMC